MPFFFVNHLILSSRVGPRPLFIFFSVGSLFTFVLSVRVRWPVTGAVRLDTPDARLVTLRELRGGVLVNRAEARRLSEAGGVYE